MKKNTRLTRTNPLFGVVEGFYGVFYTHPERLDLIRWIGRHGCNTYLYAPKNDRQHRARWWEAYPPRIMAEFAETLAAAQQSGVRFCYGISPGSDLCYSSPADFGRLTAKLRAFFEIGVSGFALLLDDTSPVLRHAADAGVYASPAEAQADFANRLYEWLRSLDPACTLIFVPVEYSGRAPFSPALTTLGSRLHPNVDLCYTGSQIVSAQLTTEEAACFTQQVGRPPLIWDNYPVNDLSMQPELHLDAIRGRDASLPGAVRGFLVNPMLQAEASKIPLLTYTAYLRRPRGYQPEQAWEQAAREVAGAEFVPALRVLHENTRVSVLGRGGQVLDALADQAVSALRGGLPLDSQPIRDLEDYLTVIDEAGYALKFRLENLALRGSLLPWIEVMEHWMWMARFALRVLRALENGQDYLGDLGRVDEYRTAIQMHPKRAASTALWALVDLTLERVARDQRGGWLPLEALDTEVTV